MDITELNDEYLALKRTDIIGRLNDNDKIIFVNLLQKVDGYKRLIKEKPMNKYVVLNLDNDINLEYLVDTIHKKYHKLGIPGLYTVKISKFAIDIANAILKTKE